MEFEIFFASVLVAIVLVILLCGIKWVNGNYLNGIFIENRLKNNNKVDVVPQVHHSSILNPFFISSLEASKSTTLSPDNSVIEVDLSVSCVCKGQLTVFQNVNIDHLFKSLYSDLPDQLLESLSTYTVAYRSDLFRGECNIDFNYSLEAHCEGTRKHYPLVACYKIVPQDNNSSEEFGYLSVAILHIPSDQSEIASCILQQFLKTNLNRTLQIQAFYNPGVSGGDCVIPTGEISLCVICQERHSSVVLMPCRHNALCSQCYAEYIPNNCPVCRLLVDYVFQI